MGKPVVLNLVSGNSKVDLRCKVVSEFDGRVRVRINDKWDVDIYKDMIGSVEADTGVAQLQLADFFEA
jgi:hypothetical protein